jgi:cytidyltransferase-like protein
MNRRVFVSGCFDLLHSGHVAFLQAAARHGELYVAVGSDATVSAIKGRPPVCGQEERLYLVRSLACVAQAEISTGSGLLDFEPELRRRRPDLFVVNEDGAAPQKEALCRALGVGYLVLPREPAPGLPARSSSALRQAETVPYRIDLAGGWLDQPFVSALCPGPVLTAAVEPAVPFDERSGMAASTRNRALELWGPHLPPGDSQKLARVLFCYDNPPGTVEVSGSQDAIGVVLPGLKRCYYEGDYWPAAIETVNDEATLAFVEGALYLVPLGPRPEGHDSLAGRRLTPAGAKDLAEAAENCWRAILARDLGAFGHWLRASFEAQLTLFPGMANDPVREAIRRHESTALGWKLSGAGGGGYLILVSERPVADAVRVRIWRGA